MVTIGWQGPVHARHWIDIVPPGHSDFAGEPTFAWLDPDSREVTLTAPEEPEPYELPDVMEDQRGNRSNLSRQPLRVAPAAEPGKN